MDTIKSSKEELEWEIERAKLCENAALGIATINLKVLEPQLVFQEFNPTRKLQDNLLRKISKSIESGECRAGSNPLVVAIDVSHVNAQTLKSTYDEKKQLPSLPPAEIDSDAKVFVLAGLHRIKAVTKATGVLEDKLANLRKRGSSGQQLPGAADKIGEVEGLIRRAQTWPTRFYDLSESQIACRGGARR